MESGYKKTDLGMIPQDWDVYKLMDIVEINPKKEILDCEKEISFIAMEHISNDGRILTMDTRKYGDVSKGYTAFKDDDVLLAKITPCFENGKKAIVKNLKNGIGFGSTEFHVLRCKDKKSIPEFIYYYISTHRFRQSAELNMTGSAGQKRVPTTFLNDNKLIVPSIKEQQKITDILSTVDLQIDDTDKLIEKTKELRTGLMQRLLTKGIGHTEFKKIEFGEVPIEWNVKKLGEIYGDLKTGSTPSRMKPEYFKGDIPWITSGELKRKFISKTNEYITGEAVNDTNLKVYPKGTFFIAITGLEAVGTRGSCGISDVDATTNQSCMAFKEKDELLNEFLYYWYMLYGNYIGIKYTQGTKQQSLNNKIVENLEIGVPTIKEQYEIVNILSAIDNEIEEYENKKAKLEELKEGLMQQLLTGKIRVI